MPDFIQTDESISEFLKRNAVCKKDYKLGILKPAVSQDARSLYNPEGLL